MKRLDRRALLGIGMTSQRRRDRLVERLRAAGIRDPRVLEVMRVMPRHLFVDEALADRAYEDCALPIGYGQTISQPYIVARMTELVLGDPAQPEPKKVLEIGTGSGYQAAVLAMLVEAVYTVERLEALYQRARERFAALRLRNVYLRHGDGAEGWPEHAPYDAILITAATERPPPALVEQLAAGGRMVLPLGAPGAGQRLTVLSKRPDGTLEATEHEPVVFVPFVPGRD
ncbi:MAG: protein-L-isoaspartate O-methyltransferase [Gammaproteobacteria bacterium]|nr:MAG: protein-L-isoaspartate O-methyltransferase [Gammaproteobacteria bacterium]